MPIAPPITASASTRRAPLNRTLQWVLWSLLGLIIAGVMASYIRQQWLAAERRPVVTLDHFGKIPAFTLIERSGQPFHSTALQGKIWLADFFFTACPGPCLVMNGRLAEIGQALRRDHADVPLVSVSIAPEADTPEVLRHYAKRFQAGSDWSFLTGDHAAIYDLAHKAFLLPLIDNSQGQVDPQDGQFIHSTRISLVDRQGELRASFDSAAPEVTQQVLTAIGELLREEPAKAGAPRG